MSDSTSVPALRELLEGAEPPVVIDVRRPHAYAESPETIPGAIRRLPDAVESWAEELPRGCQVVAYCVLGHQVSQGVVARLKERGIQATFLEGGIEQWKTEGQPVVPATGGVPGERPAAAVGDDSEAKP